MCFLLNIHSYLDTNLDFLLISSHSKARWKRKGNHLKQTFMSPNKWSNKKVDSFISTSNKACESCLLEKSHRLQFIKRTERSQISLFLLHIDIWRPWSMILCLHFLFFIYYLSIIDHFNKKICEIFNNDRKFVECKS